MECPNEKRTAALEKDLRGNGQKGVIKEVEILKTEHVDFKDDLKKIAISTSAMAKAFQENDITNKLKADAHKRRSAACEKVFSIFGIGLSVIGVVYLILDHLP
jgi:hypothetical protein